VTEERRREKACSLVLFGEAATSKERSFQIGWFVFFAAGWPRCSPG